MIYDLVGRPSVKACMLIHILSIVHQSGELEDLLEKESILPPLEATEAAAAAPAS